MTQDNVPADPNKPVIADRQDAAVAFGEWFADADPAEIGAFVRAHGQRARELLDSGDLQPSDKPRTWSTPNDHIWGGNPTP